MFVGLFLDAEKEAMPNANLTFRGPCIVIYSYNFIISTPIECYLAHGISTY
jgi:hypothetical protein